MSHLPDLVPDEPTKDITKSSMTLLVLRPPKFIHHLLNFRNRKIWWVLQHLTNMPWTQIWQLSIQNVISHNLFMLITCLILVEKLYYSAGWDACCCCCGSKRKLINVSIAIQFELCVNFKTWNKSQSLK